MSRIANSWQTVKASWTVLKKDKELLLFPVLSGLASLIVLASFVAPTVVSGLLDRAVNTEDPNAQGILALVYFAMYLTLTFVTVYFTSALIYAANERLAGGDPTVRSGLRGANQRLGRILAWSLFAGTISLLIHLLERATRGRQQFIAHLLVQLVGVAWTLATYFAIPVVVFENRGVFDSLRRSGQLFKQRWGESVVGQWGIGFVFGLLTFLVLLGTISGAYLLAGVGGAGVYAAVGVVAVGVVLLAFLTILGQALGAVYKATLYRYATQGHLVPEFRPDMIQNAYRPVGGGAPRPHW